MVGGFYVYENDESKQDFGKFCFGKSDQYGMFICDIELFEVGNVELIVSVKDGNGNVVVVCFLVWVIGCGEVWFDGENQDCIDILFEKKNYQFGEIVNFQVCMLFCYVIVLVVVECEGVIDMCVVQLLGQDFIISVLMKVEYGFNVYVLVLVVCGCMCEVLWYFFFIWGWKELINWWYEFCEYQGFGFIVDFFKLVWKFGIVEVNVGDVGYCL